jgi:hypothetical protein
MKSKTLLTIALCAASSCCCTAQTGAEQHKKLIAKTYNSGFALGHDTYNAISTASDGTIYYVLSAEPYNVAAQMFSFDPAAKKISHVGDLSKASGEKGLKVVSQGKSHVRFVESNGKLYFATHLGYYSTISGREEMGVPPAGYGRYPGGHLLSYEIASGKFESLAVAPRGEGIIAMNMDTVRGRIYFLTWPTGTFYRFDLATHDLKELGSFFKQGEAGTGPNYRTICRAIGIDPRDGSAYFTTGDGAIHRYRYEQDAVETIAGDNMKKDYFGVYDFTVPGNMAYNWRQLIWNPADNKFYGVHGNSGYLFSFDPVTERVEVLDCITSEPSKRSGMSDQFSYGYLGFTLGPDGRTLYYLTGGPIYVEGKRLAGKGSTAKGEAMGQEDLHLVTYDIPTSHYIDHGAIYYKNGDRPANVNSIAVGKDGTVYALARVKEAGAERTDLISVGPVLGDAAR